MLGFLIDTVETLRVAFRTIAGSTTAMLDLRLDTVETLRGSTLRFFA